MAEPNPGPVVVVTHHAPSALSLGHDLQFQDAVRAAYASNLEELVAGSGAALWVHGHIHRAADYSVGGTRVICNPRGYPDEPGTGIMIRTLGRWEKLDGERYLVAGRP